MNTYRGAILAFLALVWPSWGLAVRPGTHRLPLYALHGGAGRGSAAHGASMPRNTPMHTQSGAVHAVMGGDTGAPRAFTRVLRLKGGVSMSTGASLAPDSLFSTLFGGLLATVSVIKLMSRGKHRTGSCVCVSPTCAQG